MPKVKQTTSNPHGLSNKQMLVLEDIIKDIQHGKKFDPVKSTAMVYDTKNPDVISSKNLSRVNFRTALMDALHEKNIIGKNGVIETKLIEGLEAEKQSDSDGTWSPDYKIRLEYIKEINKIIGAYAPEKTQKMTFNIDGTPEELEQRIRQLEEELNP